MCLGNAHTAREAGRHPRTLRLQVAQHVPTHDEQHSLDSVVAPTDQVAGARSHVVPRKYVASHWGPCFHQRASCQWPSAACRHLDQACAMLLGLEDSAMTLADFDKRSDMFLIDAHLGCLRFLPRPRPMVDDRAFRLSVA
jgi:hypothetical protein